MSHRTSVTANTTTFTEPAVQERQRRQRKRPEIVVDTMSEEDRLSPEEVLQEPPTTSRVPDYKNSFRDVVQVNVHGDRRGEALLNLHVGRPRTQNFRGGVTKDLTILSRLIY